MPDEQERARMSQLRGRVAAGMKPGEERRKFIERQGREEAEGRENLGELGQEAFRQQNYNAVQGSMKRGGRVKKTGIYKLHRGERVVPPRARKRSGRR